MAKVYMICGSTGAGKTTYALDLAARVSSQVFSIDEWMKNLFWMDATKDGGLDWALERVQRCEVQIWQIAERLLAANLDVILDLGFSKKEQRSRFYAFSMSSGYSTYELHYLDVPVSIRKARVERRNIDKPATFQFEVSQEIFDWMEGYFEPPQNDELSNAVIVNEPADFESRLAHLS
jgi:predicted kinase